MVPELLSPAGSPEKLKYALAYGADAVYAGIPKFSLRARENPFKNDLLEDAIDYTHKMGKKIYVTANILPPNRKIESFKKSLAQHAELKPDGFIMADPGMIQFALKEFPEIPVHLSVQSNTMNWSTAEFWYDLGVKRIILSRELSLEEILEIHHRVPNLELEAFVHGSICIAYSGRCLLSNYFNHRDANQGTCTNSCRWEFKVHEEQGTESEQYKPLEGQYAIEETQRDGEMMPIDEDEHGTYIMNSKDLRAVEYLKPLQDAGVISFKIEGRSKSIYYLSLVTRAYRKAINDLTEGHSFDPSLLGEINKTANRGFTSAFLISASNRDTERFESPQEENQAQVFGGQVVNERPGWMEVEVKNRIELGDEAEYISPSGQFKFIIDAMETNAGEKATVAHGGNGTIWIKIDRQAEPFALISLLQNTETTESV
jgi:U32 family peptidase